MSRYYSFLSVVCSDYLGMENGDIPDGNIQASSTHLSFDPWKARLNGQSAWLAKYQAISQWIQADITYQTYVSGVVTQGAGVPHPDHTTSLKVSTFVMSTSDAEVFVSDEHGNVKVSGFQLFHRYESLTTSICIHTLFLRLPLSSLVFFFLRFFLSSFLFSPSPPCQN